jgi:hypothetical protein
MEQVLLNHLGGGQGGSEHSFQHFTQLLMPGGTVLGSPRLAPEGQMKPIDSLHASRGMIVTDAFQLLGGAWAEVWRGR